MLKAQLQTLGRLAVVCVLASGAAAGQTASLALSPVSAAAGGSASLNVILSSGGKLPGALQWTLTYNPAAISAISASAGPSAIAATKTLTCAPGSGVLTCLLAAINQTSIADGIVAVVNVTPVAGAASPIVIGITGVVGASTAGTAIPFVGIAGPGTSGGATGGDTSGSQPPSPAGAPPTISGIPAGVLDAGSYTANLAQGSIFVVKGANLSPAGIVQAAAYPLAASLNGISISLTPADTGVAISAYMLYTYNVNGTNQLAAILPSAATPGRYNLAVTNNGVMSAAVPVTVLNRKFELITADSSGSGAAALQNQDAAGNYSYNRFTTGQIGNPAAYLYAPAHPGDFVLVYGTGLGPIQVPDDSPPGAIDLSGEVKVQVLVGGAALAPSYAGRSPEYPGLDQVKVQLPANVATGCTVSFQVSVGGQLSNPTTISIAPPGGGTCSPAPLAPEVLSRLDQGGGLVVGNFLLSQMASTIAQAGGFSLSGRNESAFGVFTRYSGFQLASAMALLSPPGSCHVFQTVGDANQLMFGPVGTNLDAGALSLNGPNISGRSFTEDAAFQSYSLSLGILPALPAGLYLPAGFPSFTSQPLIEPGTYQLISSGGRDVGPFQASTTVDPPITLSAALPQSIDRTQDLVVSWSSANPADVVAVSGASGTVVGGTTDHPVYQAGSFLCVATAAAGSIKVPSLVLQQMPATPAVNGIGYVQVSSGPPPAGVNGLFTAPLRTGASIDSGAFLGRTGAFSTTSYQ